VSAVSHSPDAAGRVGEDQWWLPVTDAAAVAAVAQTAASVANALRMPEPRVAAVAEAAAALGALLARRTAAGWVLIRTLRSGLERGVSLVGIEFAEDPPTIGQPDHHLDVDLPGASSVDAYTWPGTGAVVTASVWALDVPAPWADGLTSPIPGEEVSGDRWAVRELDGRRQVMLCDGLGHGVAAAEASRAAIDAFLVAPVSGPRAAVDHIHKCLASTRGGVVAVAELNLRRGLVRYSGIGNIAGWVVDPHTRHGMVSVPGIAGHQRRDIREFEYPLTPATVVVMHSDGLDDAWDLSRYPGLLGHSPLVVAATLLRDARTGRDDACVVVAHPAL
jgi:hypothetical protein